MFVDDTYHRPGGELGQSFTFCRGHGGHSLLLFQGKSCAQP